jgi:hypothetical protein
LQELKDHYAQQALNDHIAQQDWNDHNVKACLPLQTWINIALASLNDEKNIILFSSTGGSVQTFHDGFFCALAQFSYYISQ